MGNTCNANVCYVYYKEERPCVKQCERFSHRTHLDQQIGIAEAHHQQVFNRFYQVTDPQEKTFPGLGIGLYIAQEIIKQHRGTIWVESSKGKGAIFFFTLPLAKDFSLKTTSNTPSDMSSDMSF